MEVLGTNLKKENSNENLFGIQMATRQAAGMVDDLVFYFGRLENRDPEREILLFRIQQIIRSWEKLVRSKGGRPGDLWSVAWVTEKGEQNWQYPCSQFFEGRLGKPR